MKIVSQEMDGVARELHKRLKVIDDEHKPESTEGRPWGQPLKKLEGAPLNLG